MKKEVFIINNELDRLNLSQNLLANSKSHLNMNPSFRRPKPLALPFASIQTNSGSMSLLPVKRRA